MKHIFVINPHAGRHDSTAAITQMVESYASANTDFNYQIHVTSAPGEATQWVRHYCTANPSDPVRFYACGGDGTLNEVATGVVGFPQAQITVYANGSGNDFIKYYGTHHDFNSLVRLIHGTPVPVDIMEVTGDTPSARYSINVCNFGFDAQVVRHMEVVRRYPIVGGSNAYTTGIVLGLFNGMRNHITMEVNGQPFFDGPMLLCSMANGRFYGGNYCCAPHAKNDDGIIDVGLFRTMSVLTLARLIGSYTKGTHLTHPAAQRYILQTRAENIDLSSTQPFWLSVDGELIQGTHFHIKNLHHALTFVSPKAE